MERDRILSNQELYEQVMYSNAPCTASFGPGPLDEVTRMTQEYIAYEEEMLSDVVITVRLPKLIVGIMDNLIHIKSYNIKELLSELDIASSVLFHQYGD